MFTKDIFDIIKDFPPQWQINPSKTLVDALSVYDEQGEFKGWIDLKKGEFNPKKEKNIH